MKRPLSLPSSRRAAPALRPFAMAFLALALLPGCLDDEIAAECLDLRAGDDEDLVKVQAFVDAAVVFRDEARTLSNEVQSTCEQMATDLEITVPPVTTCEDSGDCPSGVTCVDISLSTGLGTCGTEVEAACGAVADEITRIATEADITLGVAYEPPVCSVAVDAYAGCVADCDVNVDPGQIECMEGRLVGMCSGSCTGECRVENDSTCQGECTGSCTGTCTGTCVGACEGTCETMGSDGSCQGACTGSCTGECVGTCEGSCTGTCTVDVEGSCTGECAGSCSVDFTAPRCEVIMEPSVDVDCQAACDARVSVEASCTEPRIDVIVDIDPTTREDVMRLVNTLYANYPRFVALLEQLGRTFEAGVDFVASAEGVRAAANRLGLVAQACAIDALTAVTVAQARVNVSVSVSVEVSASINDEQAMNMD